MNIVFCYWESMCEPGMTRALKNLGHNVIVFDYPLANKDTDTEYLSAFAEFLKSTPNISFVFSVNFFPIMAKVCKIFRIPYLSYTVDSPSLTLYSKSLANPYSHAFIFDRALYEQYASRHPDNVHHLPLGSDISFFDTVSVSDEDHENYDCDVSFIGSFHTNFCYYDTIESEIPEYYKGYINGLINAQMNVYGYYLIDDSFSDEWANDFKKIANWTLLPDYEEYPREIISDFYIGYKCTQQERIRTLQRVSERFHLDLYTTENTSMIPHANNRGVSDTYKMTPKIFKCSKINLNMTARTIKSGIPLRLFEIMGVGGFVISNYQPEILEHFTPGEDLVLYDSIPDLLDKISYYLSHDEERIKIAKNGYEKVKKFHTYEVRFAEMISVMKDIF